MIRITIGREPFRQKLKGLLNVVKRPRAMMAAVGREGANFLRKHFRQKDKDEPNRLGGRREHFWLKVMRSVQAPILSEGGTRVTISITHPVYAHKLLGGIITAKRVRNLAIPQTPEAYGRSPRVFEQETGTKLFFVGTRGGGVLASRKVSPHFTDAFQVEYVLRRWVRQQPDPTAFPDGTRFEDALLARANAVLQRELNAQN
jgi:hypothetical protein